MIVIAFLLISALYFADTLLRASLKTFWYDELITVYLCRLPSFAATWSAVLHGCDFNPPLFYLFTRAAQHLFGEGLICSRLPAILGFWIFSASIFIFVRRRLGPLYGAIAALLPIFTLAHNYAYEARPHGSVLGWFGLMLVCWQRARQGRNFSLWTLALYLSSLGALLTHVYAVYLLIPFLTVEFLGVARRWQIHIGSLVALLLAPACVAPLYLRMMHAFRSSNSPSGLHIHLYEVVQQYLVATMGPALALLLTFLLLLAIERRYAEAERSAPVAGSLLPEELWLAGVLGGLIVFGVVGAKLSHGPFFSRYFLAGTGGYAILLAQAAASRGRRAFAAKGLLAAMLFLLTADTAIAAYCRWHPADLDQVEPASGIIFPTSPNQPLQRNAALLRNHDTEDILVTDDHTYFYLLYYAPQAIRDRLYLGFPDPKSPSLRNYRDERDWGHIPGLHPTSFPAFFATHREFYMYSPLNTEYGPVCHDCLQEFLDAGYTLRSVDRDTDNLLEHFSK
jgi:Dolichyl-phosphate-mannose-protein mannosyltransferase